MKRIPCSACSKSFNSANCRECHGVGYIELSTCVAKKDFLSECHTFLSFDPMVAGWECRRCGESGPL